MDSASDSDDGKGRDRTAHNARVVTALDEQRDRSVKKEDSDRLFNEDLTVESLNFEPSPSPHLDRLKRQKRGHVYDDDEEYLLQRKYRHGRHISSRPSVDGSATLLSANFNSEISQTVVCKKPLTAEENAFEIKVTNNSTNSVFAVGIGSKQFPLKSLPGYLDGSLGYHSNGKLYLEQGDQPIQSTLCVSGDRMGCGVDFSTITEGYVSVWFTKNDRLVYWPERIVYQSNMAIHPLISVGGEGEVMHSNPTGQNFPQTETMFPWYEGAGFRDTSEIPFYSKESCAPYGPWEQHVNTAPPLSADPTKPVVHSFQKVLDALWKAVDDEMHPLSEMSPATYAEWIEYAYKLLERNEKFATLSKAPSGQEFERSNHVAVYLALEVLEALWSLRCSMHIEDLAILAFLSLGFQSHFLNVTVVGGLLYLGCSSTATVQSAHPFHNPDISVSLVNLLLNWGGNPNVPDTVGRTPLHIHQTNRGLMRTFLDHNADVNAIDDDMDTPLHFACASGKIELTSLLLERGASGSTCYAGQPTPLDVAANAGHADCFQHLFRLSLKQTANSNISRQHILDKWKVVTGMVSTLKKVNTKELKELTSAEMHYATVRQPDEEETRYSVRKLIQVSGSMDVDLSMDVFTAILDNCKFGDNAVIMDMLDADTNGDVESPAAEHEGQSLMAYLSQRPSLLLSLVNHDTMRAYGAEQWQKKASKLFKFRLIFNILQIFTLTLALSIAARPGLTDAGINLYSSPIDVVRGVCEGAMILVVLVKAIDEVLELITSGIATYLMDLTNYIQWLIIILVLVMIPLRVTARSEQWIVASFLYFSYGLKLLYFVGLTNSIGSYVQALVIIVTRDVMRFMAMFLIILIVLQGSYYMASTYTASITNGTRVYIFDSYINGIRTLFEGQPVINTTEIGVLSAIVTLMFVFIVLIVLLNVLIAQVSDTYTKISSKARSYTLFYQWLYVTRQEKQFYYSCFLYPFRLLIKRIGCCMAGYQICCRLIRCQNCSHCLQQQTKLPTVRPRVVWKRSAAESTKLQQIKQKLKTLAANYLPRSMDTDPQQKSDAFSLEMALDTNHLRLKELGETLVSLISGEHEKFTESIGERTSLLDGDLNLKRDQIEKDAVWSENTKEIVADSLFPGLHDFKVVCSKKVNEVRAAKALGYNNVSKQITAAAQRQDSIHEQLFAQHERIRECISTNNEKNCEEFTKQGSALRTHLRNNHSYLQQQLDNHQEQLNELALQLKDTDIEVKEKQEKRETTMAQSHKEVHTLIARQAIDVRGTLATNRDNLKATALQFTLDIKACSEQIEADEAYYLKRCRDFEQRMNGECKGIHNFLLERKPLLMEQLLLQETYLLQTARESLAAYKQQLSAMRTN